MIGLDQFLPLTLLSFAIAGALLIVWTGAELRSRLRRFDGELYTVTGPASEGAPDLFFASLHGLLRPPLRRLLEGQPWISLEISGQSGQAGFQIWIPTGQKPFIEGLLRAAYPGVELKPAVDSVPTADSAVASVHLHRRNFLPLRTTFDSEPLSNLFWTLARPQGSEEVSLQLLVKPRTSAWQAGAHIHAQALRDGERGLFQRLLGVPEDAEPSHLERERAEAIEEKASQLGFDCAMRVVARAETPEQAREYLRAVAASLRPFAGHNGFEFSPVLLRARFLADFITRRFPVFGSFLLNTEELASLWHLPAEAPPHLQVIRSPKLPLPPGVSEGDRQIAVSTYGDRELPVRLSIPDSRRHLHLLGPTGTGKTTVMLNMALQDIAAGRGVGVIDPKGDLVAGILARMPRERLGDVVLVSPEDSNFTIGINPLEATTGADRDLIVENTLTIFKRIYERYWGMRTDDILKSALLTLLRQPNSTLAHIPLLLTDSSFRSRTLRDLHDPVGLDSFWQWFGHLSEAQRAEAIGPVLNKLRDFLVRPRLRRLLCQPHSTIDLKEIIDSGGVLLADLSTGRWGDTTAGLIGSFLVAKMWQVVLARAAVPEEKRRDFFLYIDEFQHFLGIAGPFADTLAQARSLRLCLTIANQHLGQLPRDLREAITSNARSRAVFQCGQDDAQYLSHEFAPLDAAALMSLPRFEMAARISVASETSRPFTARTLPPPQVTEPGLASEVIAASQARFGRHIEVVDRELLATLAPMGEPEISALGVGRRPRR